MTQITRHRIASRPFPRLRLGLLVGLWRQRRRLASLDDRSLSDIGISRREAEQEASRAFWDVPAHWRN
ncbi:DUF1127 domain-containing protein [Marinibacterium profundimaris]|uniref:YjiS-like domain-containing protein n=1 Tax=Marinibacterium profundimaris TaxID=1679460 RepID=A0A225NN97_9RHOB|nr:DUF1127 domain-containing protein [Marinibacterium profundimaris]OWU72530.1 hypothetical protein ATO3_15745 [Marinibacterium profundimaris]